MRTILIFVFLTGLSGIALAQGTPGAPAEKADPVAAAAKKAKNAFQSGRYEEAALAYQEAYRLEPVTTLLYNIAYLYDAHLNDSALALDYYRRYVNAPDADPTSKIKSYERITLLDKQMRRKRAAKSVKMLGDDVSKPQGAIVGSGTKKTSPGADVPAVKAAVDGAGANARVDTDDGIDPLGLTLLSVGGAALVTGGVFAILNAGTHADFEDEPTRLGKADLADTGKTQALVADISIGAGAVLALTGLILILSDDDSTVAPTASASGAGLSFGGRF